MLAGLGITTGFWFAPKLHAALTQATYAEQFCLVLNTNSSSGCVQVSKPQCLNSTFQHLATRADHLHVSTQSLASRQKPQSQCS